jgi:hypothetical protein
VRPFVVAVAHRPMYGMHVVIARPLVGVEHGTVRWDIRRHNGGTGRVPAPAVQSVRLWQSHAGGGPGSIICSAWRALEDVCSCSYSNSIARWLDMSQHPVLHSACQR